MFARITILIISILIYSIFYILISPGIFYIDDTPLTTAIKQNDSNKFKSLMETENFEIKDGSGSPPLSIAVNEVNIEFVKLLLEKGANPNARSDFADRPIVYEAASSVCYPGFNRSKETARNIIQMLIEYGADVNSRTALGETAILWAAKCGDAELASILVKNGANVNLFSLEGIPLHQAIYESRRSKSYKTIEVLIGGGANPRAKNFEKEYGITALDLAKKYNDKHLQKILERSDSTASLSHYSSKRNKITYNSRRIESILYRYGIRVPANTINVFAKNPFVYLILPTFITFITGIFKKDMLLQIAASLQLAIIIIGFIILLFIGASGS